MKLYKNILALTLMTSTAFAAQVPQSFTYQGRAFNQDGTVPITSSIDLTLGVYAPNGCLLYEETQTGIDLSHSEGKFSVQVGTSQGSGMRTSNDPGLSMAQVFANAGAQIRPAGAGCASGYTPAAGDVRKLHVQIGVNGGSKVMISPDMVIAAVPTAMVAETLQGKSPTDFVQLDGSVSQASMDSLTNGSEASALHNHDSLYLRKDAASITLPQASVTSVGSSNSSVTNKSYVDSAVSGVQTQITAVQGKQSTDETAINSNSTSIGSLQTSVSNNSSAITGLQSSVNSLNTSVSAKADKSYVDSSVSTKADKSYVDSSVSTKANTIDVNTALATKLSLSGGTLTGNLQLYQNIAEGSFNSSDTGKLWYSPSSNRLRVWDGTAIQSLATMADLSGYATSGSLGSTYLTQANAASTYLTQANAASTYLTQSNAATTYLTQSSAASTYATTSSLSNYALSSTLSFYLPLTGGKMTGVFQQYNTLSDPSVSGSSDSGKTWFNATANRIKYWDGSATQTVATQADLSGYATSASLGSTYLTQSSATTTYLTQSSATTTYLTQANATSTYATIASDALKLPLAGGTLSGAVSTTSQISYKNFSASSQTIDWNNGQIQTYTVPSATACGTFTFSNMKDGGSYTLAVTMNASATTGTCAFATDATSGSFADASFKSLPDKANTAGKTEIFNFQRIGTTVYMTNTGPF